MDENLVDPDSSDMHTGEGYHEIVSSRHVSSGRSDDLVETIGWGNGTDVGGVPRCEDLYSQR